MSSAGSVWYMLELKLYCEILLLLNMADMVGVSNTEYLVHLVGMNRLSAFREFVVNGTICRDGVVSFPSSLVGF